MTRPTVEELPHVPAAFINALADEGTKVEAVTWLQQIWNERCALSAQVRELREENERLTGCLSVANAHTEEFERKYYLETDKVEKLEQSLATAREEAYERAAVFANDFDFGLDSHAGLVAGIRALKPTTEAGGGERLPCEVCGYLVPRGIKLCAVCEAL